MADAVLMKGLPWHKAKRRVVYPVAVEVKVDEIRCRVVVNPQNWDVVFLSYAEKPLHNLEEFAPMWAELAKASGWYEFDTGFMVDKSFDSTYRWVRSSKGLPKDLLDVPTEFILFDLPGSLLPYRERITERSKAAVLGEALGLDVRAPEVQYAHNEEEVQKMFSLARYRGQEGLMLKNPEHLYARGKRTADWIKVKPEQDADGVVSGFKEAISADGTPHGRAGSVLLRMEDGSEAWAHGIEHALARDMWQNQGKYLGLWGTLNYMERDRQGGYRHPTFVRIREDKA